MQLCFVVVVYNLSVIIFRYLMPFELHLSGSKASGKFLCRSVYPLCNVLS